MFYTLPKNLSELDHFRSNPMVQFKEENVGDVDVVIPYYMIADADLWKQPMALELRGHVFRKDTGELISAALPKFFNVGENDYTQRSTLPWNMVSSITDKVDGSMASFALINGKVYAKTKKSFYSDVAVEIQKFIDTHEHYYKVIKSYLKMNFFPIYEFYHPDWQVVLNYGDRPMMKLLGNRCSYSGDWYPSFDSNFDTPDLNSLEQWQKTAVDVEGVVVQFADGRIVKAKTEWYLQQYKVRTQMRERDVAEMAALEQLDDVKSLVSNAGLDLGKIEWIEKSVAVDIASIREQVEGCVGNGKINNLLLKSMAEYYNRHPYFGMIMRAFRGQEVNYVEYFLKNILKEKYSLKNVYNEKF